MKPRCLHPLFALATVALLAAAPTLADTLITTRAELSAIAANAESLAGITPLVADDMTDKSNFPASDFIDTWIITEADGAPDHRGRVGRYTNALCYNGRVIPGAQHEAGHQFWQEARHES